MLDEADVHVGQRVYRARTAKKLKQAELGQMVGVSYQQIQKYEKGANRIGGSRLWKIAKALEVPVAYFFEGLEAPSSHSDSATWWNLEWAKQLDNIPNKKIHKHIVGLIKACAKEK